MVNVEDEEILEMMKVLGRNTGIFGEPAGVTGLAGLRKMVDQGFIKPDEKVVTVITGNGLKDIKSAQKAAGQPLDVKPDINKLKEVFKKEEIIE
jgi:threonine synthase